ncbi:MAG: tryptophan--tRNA ligase [Elusimicrobia bacterium]|nr:tryptophan--tRNA ligase [Elusimicrobiota bacterium]
MSGMRPTGRLHLGNYWGALKNWVELQAGHACYFAVADWHMLTTGYEDTSRLLEDEREMVLDWLAAGVDPERSVVFRQSDVPEHAELALLLSMITPLSWLENNPTWKEQLQELARTKRERLLASEAGAAPSAAAIRTVDEAEARAELRTHGFLGYPVLQAADILLYGGELVPVGQDQLPHLELSREIARRFNALYGGGRAVLKEPQPLLTPTPRVPGLDGRKMSKSYANAVDILESGASLSGKVMTAYTDPTRLRAKDPGHPEPCAENPPGCSVYALHALYSGHWERRGDECRAGAIGCVACKKDLLASMEPRFAELRERRERYGARPGQVAEILEDGRRKAKAAAERTMDAVRRAMRLRER